jgi:hypothetical protein
VGSSAAAHPSLCKVKGRDTLRKSPCPCSPVFLAVRGSRVRWCLTANFSGQQPSGISATGQVLGQPEFNSSLGGLGHADALLGADALLLGGGVLVGGLLEADPLPLAEALPLTISTSVCSLAGLSHTGIGSRGFTDRAGQVSFAQVLLFPSLPTRSLC